MKPNLVRFATYLIYAGKDENGLVVSLCSRTTPLAAAKTGLKELGDGEKPKEEKKQK